MGNDFPGQSPQTGISTSPRADRIGNGKTGQMPTSRYLFRLEERFGDLSAATKAVERISLLAIFVAESNSFPSMSTYATLNAWLEGTLVSYDSLPLPVCLAYFTFNMTGRDRQVMLLFWICEIIAADRPTQQANS